MKIKTIFDNGRVIPATHIDGYLLDAPDVFIENRSRTRGSVSLPNMSKGSQPTDGGNLILSPAVYTNFPWPELGGSGKSAASPRCAPTGEAALSPLHAAIESTAQAILDARSRYPESSLADLYDPLAMPPDLRAAHEANDRAVLAAYGLAHDTPEPEIVAHLFKLYAEKVAVKK
ncbi:MAG: hypothetical protein IJJ84_01590 [Kiritimatiellae bacterium]|nr:hypothetical protein [Kiritimatiellia bacterium]